MKKKKKIIVVSGVPGSGKSFLANKIHQKYLTNSIIVNNDLLRMMLTGTNETNVESTYKRTNTESIRDYIVNARDAIISAFLSVDSVDVIIVDACHFSKESTAFFKLLQNVEIIYVLLDTNPDEAFNNAQSRVRKEGREIICFIGKELEKLGQKYDFILKNDLERTLFLENI